VTQLEKVTLKLVGIGLPEFPAPRAHGFIGQADAAFGHQLFHVAVAQAEAEIQLDTVANDLGREPMTLVRMGCWWCSHAVSMSHEGWTGKRKLI
jgi:hypothetical protein